MAHHVDLGRDDRVHRRGVDDVVGVDSFDSYLYPSEPKRANAAHLTATLPAARFRLVEADIVAACRSGALGGYATDVLDKEPPAPGHPFLGVDNIIVTPHVGSRTFESVERQGLRAAHNIVNFLRGDPDYIQANAPSR